MTENLHGIAHAVESIVPLEPGDLVVDIGCNDGTLFDGYQAEGLRYVGFDPSDVSKYAVEKGYDVGRDFTRTPVFGGVVPSRKRRRLPALRCFTILKRHGTFVADVAEALAEGGIWVIELHYLPAMLEANAFDAIVHEHLEYYSLAAV